MAAAAPAAPTSGTQVLEIYLEIPGMGFVSPSPKRFTVASDGKPNTPKPRLDDKGNPVKKADGSYEMEEEGLSPGEYRDVARHLLDETAKGTHITGFRVGDLEVKNQPGLPAYDNFYTDLEGVKDKLGYSRPPPSTSPAAQLQGDANRWWYCGERNEDAVSPAAGFPFFFTDAVCRAKNMKEIGDALKIMVSSNPDLVKTGGTLEGFPTAVDIASWKKSWKDKDFKIKMPPAALSEALKNFLKANKVYPLSSQWDINSRDILKALQPPVGRGDGYLYKGGLDYLISTLPEGLRSNPDKAINIVLSVVADYVGTLKVFEAADGKNLKLPKEKS